MIWEWGKGCLFKPWTQNEILGTGFRAKRKRSGTWRSASMLQCAHFRRLDRENVLQKLDLAFQVWRLHQINSSLIGDFPKTQNKMRRNTLKCRDCQHDTTFLWVCLAVSNNVKIHPLYTAIKVLFSVWLPIYGLRSNRERSRRTTLWSNETSCRS